MVWRASGNPPPLERVPAGINLRPVSDGEDRNELIAAHSAAFKGHWGYRDAVATDWWAERDDIDVSLSIVAVFESQIVGFSLCGIDRVAELGVVPAWRHFGLGEALLRRTIRDLAARGAERIALEVDELNETGAVDMYERVGFERESAVTIWGQPISSGR
jgi:ribosomal protein S18 acetylase RimI-like enzyme